MGFRVVAESGGKTKVVKQVLMKVAVRNRILAFWLCIMFVVQGCGIQEATTRPIESGKDATTPRNKEDGLQKGETGISKEEALTIAKEEALKTYESLEAFNVVACETARAWIIIYDGGGPEYVIRKESGLVLSGGNAFQGLGAGVKEYSSSRKDDWISEQEAIEIAKQEARTDFGEAMDRYNVFACELARVWTVSFEYRQVPGELLPNSRSPFYVIDKRTGKVIYKGG